MTSFLKNHTRFQTAAALVICHRCHNFWRKKINNWL